CSTIFSFTQILELTAGVVGPFEYIENALHAFFMMKSGSGQFWELEELKKISDTNAYKRDLPRLNAFF
ncbi:unnamed protein product, partial [Staurois parvus]